MWDSVFKDKRKLPNSSGALLLVGVSGCPARPSQTVSWFLVAFSGLRSESLSSWACLVVFLVFHHVLCLLLEPRVSKACPHSKCHPCLLVPRLQSLVDDHAARVGKERERASTREVCRGGWERGVLCSFQPAGRVPQHSEEPLLSPQLDCIRLFHLLAQCRHQSRKLICFPRKDAEREKEMAKLS